MKYILTITGASGSGKDSLLDAIMYIGGAKSADNLAGIAFEQATKLGGGLRRSIRELISCTTREPRPGERHGIDKCFMSFDEIRDVSAVAETTYAGNIYKLPESELEHLAENSIGAVILDRNGVENMINFVSKNSSEYKLIKVFIAVDESTSRERMLKRGDPHDMIEPRLIQQKQRDEYAPVLTNGAYDLILDGRDKFTTLVDRLLIFLNGATA